MFYRLLVPLAAIMLCVSAAAQEPGIAVPGRGGQPPMPGGRGGRLGMPPRDNTPPPTGTAKITGRVLSAETGTPIRRAQISLNSRDARVNRNVATDAEGRYELDTLPPGRYRLSVNKAGYVPLEYGQARPFESGKPLDLAVGQTLEKIDFSLPRGSVITGRITDEFGDPITDVQVQALRFQSVNGERQLVTAGRTARTDDLGQYRIFGLMPGEYIVHASLREMPPGAREGAVEPTGYPGTYFPGVADASQAQTVSVTIGQELSAIGFPLVPARFARVAGIILASDGRPLGGAILVIRPRLNGLGLANLLGGAGRSAADAEGRFSLARIPPGEYVLEVQQRPDRPQNMTNNALTQLEFASVPLTVSDDIENLTVSTTAGVTVSGRVVYLGQNAPRSGLQIMAISPDGAPPLRALAGRALGSGRVNADGTFEVHGLFGPHYLRPQNIPSGWMLKSVQLDGTDITDTPFDFRTGNNMTGAVVTLTDRLSEITGSVRDARGQSAADYVLVVFPEDAKLWGAASRFVQTTRPNQNGVFSIKGLPAGRYLAAVVPSLENGLQNDRAVLERLRTGAEGFSLTEGGVVNLNLQMP